MSTASPLSPPRTRGTVVFPVLMLLFISLPVVVAFVLGMLATN